MSTATASILAGLLQLAGLGLLVGSVYAGLWKWSIGADAIKKGEVPDPKGNHQVLGLPDKWATKLGFEARLTRGDPSALKVIRLKKYLIAAASCLLAATMLLVTLR